MSTDLIATAAMILLSAYTTWVPFRAWHKGVIRVRSTTKLRSEDPRGFLSDVVFTSVLAVLYWIGTGVMIYRLTIAG